MARTQDLIGRQLLAGSAFDGDHSAMAVMAYLADDPPDPTFGTNGRLVVGQSFFNPYAGHLNSTAAAIRAYDSERFVVGGYFGDFLGGFDFLLARFRQTAMAPSFFFAVKLDMTGVPDNTFDGDGITVANTAPTTKRFRSTPASTSRGSGWPVSAS